MQTQSGQAPLYPKRRTSWCRQSVARDVSPKRRYALPLCGGPGVYKGPIVYKGPSVYKGPGVYKAPVVDKGAEACVLKRRSAPPPIGGGDVSPKPWSPPFPQSGGGPCPKAAEAVVFTKQLVPPQGWGPRPQSGGGPSPEAAEAPSCQSGGGPCPEVEEALVSPKRRGGLLKSHGGPSVAKAAEAPVWPKRRRPQCRKSGRGPFLKVAEALVSPKRRRPLPQSRGGPGVGKATEATLWPKL